MLNLTDEILFFLSNNPGNYRALRARLSGNYIYDELSYKREKKKEAKINKRSFRTLLSRLKTEGYIKSDKGFWLITKKGIKKFKNKNKFTDYHRYQKAKNSTNKIIISFDIPESLRARRTWLRKALLSLDFIMLQQSVWLGPYPLPGEFIDDLKIKEIDGYIKFFAVKTTAII